MDKTILPKATTEIHEYIAQLLVTQKEKLDCVLICSHIEHSAKHKRFACRGTLGDFAMVDDWRSPDSQSWSNITGEKEQSLLT